jgi:hypothetical protein
MSDTGLGQLIVAVTLGLGIYVGLWGLVALASSLFRRR